MIRIFNRYISLRNSVYLIIENILILTFLLWGAASGHITPEIAWFYPLASLLICQFSLYCSDIHLPVPRFSLRRFLWDHFRVIIWPILALLSVFVLVSSPTPWQPLLWRLILFPFLIIGLRLVYQVVTEVRYWDTTVLIIGSAPIAGLIKNILFYDRSLGYRALHFRWELTSPDTLAEEWQRLSHVVATHKIKKILIALQDRRGQLPVESLLSLRVQGVEVIDAVSFYENLTGRLLVSSIHPSSLIFGEGFFRPSLLRTSKRLIDLFLSIIGMIVGIPFFIILPILIKMTSKGPVIYSQERVGEGGKPFMVMKFRSMYEDAEVKSGPVWASKNDPRVTPLGRVMRSLRFDEIPQLLNVLRGEMSLVGPRPERPNFVEQLRKKIPYYALRFSVKPGVTGWAQVKYQYSSTEKESMEKLEYDLYYAKHLSLLFDLTILLETIRVVFTRKGAY